MAAPTERTGPSVNSLTPPVTEAIQPDHDASLSGAPAGGRATDRGLREARPPDKDAYSLAGTSKTIASPRRENGSPGPTPRRRESGVTRALLRGAPAMSRASATWPRGVIKVQAEERVGSGQVPPPDHRNRHPTALEAALIVALIVAHQDLLPVVQRHLAVRTRPGIDHESRLSWSRAALNLATMTAGSLVASLTKASASFGCVATLPLPYRSSAKPT